MKTVDALLRSEADGTLSFGDFSRAEKAKLSDFVHAGDTYKVKTCGEITKLEKNETFVYESVPGSSVFNFKDTAAEISFAVSAQGSVQITLELEAEKDYEVLVDGMNLGRMATNLGGKLVLSVDARPDSETSVKIIKD